MENEDCISELPDDILAKILSYLALIEAAATSLVSIRWRELWKLYDGSFDFDGSITVFDLKKQLDLGSQSLDIEKIKFVNWVNQVLEAHQGATMKGLRIIFPVDSTRDLDNWIKIAVNKKVQQLRLDLTHPYETGAPTYDFPPCFLTYSSFSFLTYLCLKFVNISEETLQRLLIECPKLEKLIVYFSNSIRRLKVSGPSLKLDFLTLCFCDNNLEFLQISAPNLSVFIYWGPHIKEQVFEDVPRLKEVYHTGHCRQFESHLPQLQKFGLNASFCPCWSMVNVPELHHLQTLEMITDMLDRRFFLHFAAILNVAPSLEKFTLQIKEEDINPRPGLTKEMCDMIKDHRYNSLKTVELHGFVGRTTDVQFITHFFNRATLLEEIILDACKPQIQDTPEEILYREKKEYLEARDRAIELKTNMPIIIVK